MIIVSGRLYVDPQARDAYLAACLGIIEQARSAPGCLDFVLAADPIEPGRINVYEQWESDEHLARFRGAGPEPAQTAEIREARVLKHRISASESP